MGMGSARLDVVHVQDRAFFRRPPAALTASPFALQDLIAQHAPSARQEKGIADYVHSFGEHDHGRGRRDFGAPGRQNARRGCDLPGCRPSLRFGRLSRELPLLFRRSARARLIAPFLCIAKSLL